MGHTKVSGGHSEWYRDGTGAPHQGQSLRVVVTRSECHSEWYRDGTVVVTKVRGSTPRSVVVTQSGIEMGHTKVSGGHSEWNRDGTHQGQWWSLRVDIEMGHTKVSGGHSEWYRDGTGAPHQGQVVTQSGIEMGHTKVSGGHSLRVI